MRLRGVYRSRGDSIALLGQPAYNLVFGLAWVSSALALLVFLFLVYGRK